MLPDTKWNNSETKPVWDRIVLSGNNISCNQISRLAVFIDAGLIGADEMGWMQLPGVWLKANVWGVGSWDWAR